MASSIMFSASYVNAMSLETVIGTKRTIHSPDGLNLKKRRKQSKPVRIASTEDSTFGEDQQATGIGSNLSPNNFIVSGNFSISSDIKMTPLNLSKDSSPNEGDNLQINVSESSQSESDGAYNKQIISPNSNNLSQRNNLAFDLPSNVNIDASQIKIFNPEAFCDLCNKEFCNKYFLKTHRANKHGVYSDVPCNPNPDQVHSKIMTPSSDLPHQNNLFLPKTWSGKKTNYAGNGIQNKNHLIKNHNNGISSTQRAFCNICRKEFCNKYFVRRHKVKIHGIADTTSESSCAEGKNCSELISNVTECNQDSTNDSETFLERDDLSKNQWHYQNISTLKITCNFCDEEMNDSKTLFKHLEEVHNNPDGEINLETKITLQNNILHKETEFTEQMKIEPTTVVNLKTLDPYQSSISEIKNDTKMSDNENFETENVAPLNLVLNHNDNLLANDTKTSEVCLICGEQFFSLNMYQTHMMEAHYINVQTTENIEQEINRKESLNPLNHTEKTSDVSIEKEKQDIKSLHKMVVKMNYAEITVCDICDYDFKSIYYLEHHILRYHRQLLESVNAIIEEDCNALNQNRTNNKDSPENSREDSNIQQDNTQMSSFCDICKKELCNKYFMKTHMQRMHGISIETGTHIGGVVCDICNKELCSKYFLRVHKQNSHGLADDSLLPRLWVEDLLKTSSKDKSVKCEEAPDSTDKPNKNLCEVCPKCNKRFRLAKWLRVHMSVEHGEETQQSSTPPHETSSLKATFLPTELRHSMEKESTSINLSSTSSAHPESLCIATNPEADEQVDFVMTRSESQEKPPESFQVLSNMLSGKDSNSKQYRCSQCPFTTSALAFLYVHERCHSQDTSLWCPICSMVFETKESLHVHFSLHENIQPVEIHSRFGNICWTDGGVHPNKLLGQDPETSGILSGVRESILEAAKKLHNPLSFAVPFSQESFVMQPFFLESNPLKESITNDNVNNFLSSLVFLPVKEKSSTPTTISLKLTPV